MYPQVTDLKDWSQEKANCIDTINNTNILIFVSLRFMSLQDDAQRSAYMIRCGLRVASLSKSTEADAGNNADYQHRNRT